MEEKTTGMMPEDVNVDGQDDDVEGDPCEGCLFESKCPEDAKMARRGQTVTLTGDLDDYSDDDSDGDPDEDPDEDHDPLDGRPEEPTVKHAPSFPGLGKLPPFLQALFDGMGLRNNTSSHIVVTDPQSGKVEAELETRSMVLFTAENVMVRSTALELKETVQSSLISMVRDRDALSSYSSVMAGFSTALTRVPNLTPLLGVLVMDVVSQALTGHKITADDLISRIHYHKVESEKFNLERAKASKGDEEPEESTDEEPEDKKQSFKEDAEEVLEMMKAGPESRNQA